MDPFYIPVDEATIKKQKQKARVLRNSQWWKRRRSQGVCGYCGGRFHPKELTMDHIVPVSRGGRSVKSNVVPCCKPCNTKKHNLLPIEWDAYMASMKNSDIL